MQLTFVTQTEDDHDPHFEPVIKLTEEVVTKTNEEDETVVFKLYVSFSADPFLNQFAGGLSFPLINLFLSPLGVQNSSGSILERMNGRSEGRARRDCCSTRKRIRFALLCGAKRRSRCAPTI